MKAHLELKRVTTDEVKTTPSVHAATLFAIPVPSLQEIACKSLLERKEISWSMQKLQEFFTKNNIPEPIKLTFKNACLPLLAQRLRQLVVQDKKAETRAMLEEDASLMFIEPTDENSMTMDHLGRPIEGSAFRIALAAKSRRMLAESMFPFISRVENGFKLASEQLEKQSLGEKKEPFNFNKLVVAITAEKFVDAQLSSETDVELEKLRNHFRWKVIRSGCIFNYEIYVQAVKIFYRNFNNWNKQQRNFFCQHVLAYLQNLFPACDALALRKGLVWQHGDFNQKAPDSDFFVNGKFIDLYGRQSLGYEKMPPHELYFWVSAVEDQLNDKERYFENLKHDLEDPNRYSCVIL